jgi:hypothetical protein
MRARGGRDESGQVLILSVILLVVMLGISALVIDLGYAKSEHRKLQNAADSSALGAAQSLATDTESAATSQAVTLGNDNLPKYSPLNFGGVCDSAPLAIISSAGNCISYSPAGLVRVRIPEQTFSTLFGGIIGFHTLRTGAVAEAQIEEVGPGGIEPFLLLSGFNSGSFCLDSGGGGSSTQPCDGAFDGNFGLLAFTHCGINASFRDDIAAGADHPYGIQQTQGVNVVPDDCTHVDPNQVLTNTGNQVGQETPALVGNGTFSDGGPARLFRVPGDPADFSPSWETTSDGLDNRPLWEFIPTTAISGSVPNECQRAAFDAPGTGLLALHPNVPGPALQQDWMNWGIDRCIFEYTCGKLDTSIGPTDPKVVNPATRYNCNGVRAGAAIAACGGVQCRAPVFTANTNPNPVNGLDAFDVVQSPRFVHVPELWQTTPPSGTKTDDIRGFRAVFIQRLAPNNGAGFEPGPWNAGLPAPVSHVADITGFVFPEAISGCVPTDTDSCGTMLPGTLGTNEFSIGFDSVVELVS